LSVPFAASPFLSIYKNFTYDPATQFVVPTELYAPFGTVTFIKAT
jgi:hypothetical protein